MPFVKILLPLIFAFFCFPFIANAEVIFHEDFNDGNANGWNIISGESLWRVENGRYGARIDSPSTEIISIAGEIQVSSYVIELDITPVAGADKNIVFRWKDFSALTSGPLYHYSAHFNDDNGGTLHLKKFGTSQNGWPISVPAILNHNQTYRVKVVLKDQKVEFYVDGNKLAEGVDLDYTHEGNERVMLYISTGGAFPTEVWFDNIIVKTLDEDDLDVPLIKQISEPWQSHVYDSANIWSPLNPTVNRWGCALTSAVMVLKYNGINKMPDSTSVDPGNVNLWLKSQKDGYIRNGLINWLAVSRLSKKAISTGLNPGISFDALEYKRVSGYDPTYLSGLINDSIPAILEEPGHYVVAKGHSGNTFSINDPYFNRLTISDGYNNSFLSLGEYTPHNTDLSYIMLLVPVGINITLNDAVGNSVGNQFIQQPISDPLSSQKSGKRLKTIYLQKPNSGNYFVNLSSFTAQEYVLDSYFYDINGEVSVFTNTGTLSPNAAKKLPIIFDGSDASKSSIKKGVTFKSINEYIANAVREKKITKAMGNTLLALLNTAEKSYKLRNIKVAKSTLTAMETFIKTLGSKGMSSDVLMILSADLKELRDSLK